MQKVREILLNEYIGAITIGFLLAQAVGIFVSMFMRPINFYLENRGRQHGVFNPVGTEFPWNSLVSPGLNLVLYLAVAFGLLYWLYLKQTSTTPPAGADESVDESAGNASEL